MKNLLIVFLSVLVLSSIAINADAGFVITKRSAASYTSTSAATTAGHRRAERRKHKKWLQANDNSYHIQQAKIAFNFALWGLLLGPLGIPAIIHGIRSLKKREWYYHDMAFMSILLGTLDMLMFAFIIALVIFLLV
jgi:hypothetical protein